MGLISICGKPIKLGGGTINVASPDPEIYVTPSEITSVSYLGATCPVNVCGNKNGSVTVADACTWLVTTSPVTPSNPPGTVNNIQICENITSSCRSGVVCYTPSLGGTVKCVTICQSTGDTNIYVTPALTTGLNGGQAYAYEYVCGPTSNSTAFATSCSWIHATTPVSPCASPGRLHTVCIDCNTVCACRCGTFCYTPTCGTMRTITVCQNACITWKCLDYSLRGESGYEGYYTDCKCMCVNHTPARTAGDCYDLEINWDGYIDSGSLGCGCMRICCGATVIYNQGWDYNDVYSGGYYCFPVDNDDIIHVTGFICEYSSGYVNYLCVDYSYIYNCASSCSQFCNGTGCQSWQVCTA